MALPLAWLRNLVRPRRCLNGPSNTRLAITPGEEGASRVIDCKTIGGLVGGKGSPRAGRVRKVTAATGSCTPRKSQVTTIRLRQGMERRRAVRCRTQLGDQSAHAQKRNEQAWRDH